MHTRSSFTFLILTISLPLFGCQSGPASGDLGPTLAGRSVWPFPEGAAEEPEETQPNPWVVGFGGAPSNDDFGSQPAMPGASSGGQSSTQGPSTSQENPGPTEPPPLLTRRLEEYWEGSGSQKLLRISGELGSSPSPCVVEIYSNGGTSPWRRLMLPDELPATGVLSLCSSSIWDEACDVELSGSVFNGDDALVLRCGDETMDSLGRVGEDPGNAWIGTWDPTVESEGQHLVRCDSDRDTDPSDAFDVSAQWAQLLPGETIAAARTRCPTPMDPGLGGAPARQP